MGAVKYPWIFAGVLMPTVVLALSYETDTLPYTDVPSDLPTQVAISTLTELEILRGNPDGTFKPNVPINRAEFMKIAMGLLPPTTDRISTRCFPDVDPNIWFAEPVCRAKILGIVSGNALPDINPDLWPFEPTRSVKYEEALKILSSIYDVPLLNASGEWYEKYIRSAENLKINLSDSVAGSALTRGQMARLVVAFLAYNHNELDELRHAETHSSTSSVRTVFSAPSSSGSSVSSISSSVSSAGSESAIYDDLPDTTSTDDAVLVLGKVTHILGSAKIFSNAEPVYVKQFVIDLVAGNSSLEAMNVYDERGKFLGRATKNNDKQYILRTKDDSTVIGKREEYTFYVRGILRAEDQGGTSGGSLEIDEMGIEGVGVWSNRDYSISTISQTFAQSTVARSAITSITNAGDERSILVEGTDLEIGAFRFEGVTGHSAARLQITDIDFNIGRVGTITISNPTIRVDGVSEAESCSIASNTLTCGNLPDHYGRLDDGTRILRVYADIAVDPASQSAGVQLTINDPGTISSPGSITWTDGVTVFTWIDSGNKPVARGTYYSR